MQASWISLQAWALLTGRQTFKVLTQDVQNIHFSIILHAHISALIATMGDVNAAVERLLGGGLQVKAFDSLSCQLNNLIFRGRALGETISL